MRRDRFQVNVAVPTDLNDAGLLYKPGNTVQLEGELDCVVVERRERGGVESATVQRLRAEWQERESASDEERSAYLRQLRRLSDAPRWRVLAGHIEAVGEAEAITEREARARSYAGYCSRSPYKYGRGIATGIRANAAPSLGRRFAWGD